MKLKDLILIKEEFGEQYISDIISQFKHDNNLNYLCVKCNGKGTMEVTYNAYPPNYEWDDDLRTKVVDCDLCDGHGYTINEYTTVTKYVRKD